MIISHEHRFAFLKTHKTAGTSVEVQLSKIAGTDAVVTPFGSPEPGHEPRNYRSGSAPRRSWGRRPRPVQPLEYFNHMTAQQVLQMVGVPIFDEYYSFAVERDPWEKAVSWYRFEFHLGRTVSAFDSWLRESIDRLSDWPIYTVDDAVVVRRLVEYRELHEFWTRELPERLEMAVPPLGRSKRFANSGIDVALTGDQIEVIADRCRYEIEHFGYERPRPGRWVT